MFLISGNSLLIIKNVNILFIKNKKKESGAVYNVE